LQLYCCGNKSIEAACLRGTYNTMAKRKRTKGQITINKKYIENKRPRNTNLNKNREFTAYITPNKLRNVNTICWCCWNIATVEWEVDCLKSKVTPFVFNLPPFTMSMWRLLKVRNILLSILYLHFFVYIYYNVLVLLYNFYIDCILQCMSWYVDEGLRED
jgi:hypothetical protein